MSCYHPCRNLLIGIAVSIALSLIGCKDAMVNSPDDANNKALSKNSGQNVVERPITDFTSTQYGQYGLLYGFYDQNNPKYFFVIDYAGTMNNYWNFGLGTYFEGKILEKPLPDGTAEVHVMLKTYNALTYVVDYDAYFLHGYPLEDPRKWVTYFGASLRDIVNDNEMPTLGTIKWDFKFINSSMGAPIPNMVDIVPTRISEYITASSFGPLKEIAGFGPDGTPGHAWTTQVGLFSHTEPPAGDGWPVEYVKVQAVGRIE